MSKSKGGRWERDFVAVCGLCGLGAKKVPLSGALADYPDDVVITVPVLLPYDVRVECKYRKGGAGFKRLYGWLGSATDLVLETDGLLVRRIEHYAADVLANARIVQRAERKGASRKVMLDWMGEANVLALRMATPARGARQGKSPWLMVTRLGDSLAGLPIHPTVAATAAAEALLQNQDGENDRDHRAGSPADTEPSKSAPASGGSVLQQSIFDL